MGYKMKGSPAKFWPWGKKSTTKNYVDNPDVESKRTVRTSKRGTTIKETGYKKSKFNYSSPGGPGVSEGLGMFGEPGSEQAYKEMEARGYGTYTPRGEWSYGEGEHKKDISSRKLKSKLDKEGKETRRKEKIVYDDGKQSKKVTQRKVKFGKNKGKIKSKTVHWEGGKKTVTKKYTDAIDASPIKKK